MDATAKLNGQSGIRSGLQIQSSTVQDSSNGTIQNGLPAVTMPKGGGAIRSIGEQFSVNTITGTASTSIPIPTSQARSGIAPQLNLTYDSGSGNGPFGFGWQISLPSITRKTDKGLPKYHDDEESDIFILTGNEDLLPVLELDDCGEWVRVRQKMQASVNENFHVQRYRPRVEASFTLIERWTDSNTGETHWRSISRDNVTTIFGSDDNSRIFDPENPGRVFTFLASHTYDDKGNCMKYEYKAENSEGIDVRRAHESGRSDLTRSAGRYPKRIRYGNRRSRLANNFHLQTENWMFEVVFDYGDHDKDNPSSLATKTWPSRNDPFSTYRPTFELRTYRLCERILMFHNFPEEKNIGNDCLVSSIDLNYRDTCEDHSSNGLGNSIATFISSISQRSYVRTGNSYVSKSHPPIEFEYSRATISDIIHDIDPESLENLPIGLQDPSYQWLDLNGEGVNGILSRESDALFYKPNVGKGKFGPVELLLEVPSLFTSPNPSQQWLDLSGDGNLDIVQFDESSPGFYKRDSDSNTWEGFRAFSSIPIIPWNDPNLKLIDVTGDGWADILIVNEEIFTYYASLAENGFATPNYWRPPLDEDLGPRVLLADRLETIYLADMSGDGLSDLVRVRNSEICYWPNLGYGNFGAKVIMNNTPWFDYPDVFRQNLVRLADIDGSGTTDIVYLGGSGACVYFNQSGNSWTDGEVIESFPVCTDAHNVQVIDLLGQGTACLVWSSSLPSDYGRQMRYIDLLSGGKPYLMTSMANNLGAETHISYSTSTSFYLADKADGNPWATRIPFPIHIVSAVEKLDMINGNRFITRHAYHEGYFDGFEREFRGFGFVETWDTEDFDARRRKSELSQIHNFDPSFTSPPVLTKTWYYTGAFFENKSIMRHFRRRFYNEPGLSTLEADDLLLPEPLIPSSIRLGSNYLAYELAPEELRESYRALKGSILRQETYAIDGTPLQMHPYKITQNNYTIDMLQPLGPNHFAMYFTHPKESVEFDYERALFKISGQKLADPRISHSMILSTDEFGNVLESVIMNYGRRHDDSSPILTLKDRLMQKGLLATLTLQAFTNKVHTPSSYRTPLLYESQIFELVNLPKTHFEKFTPLISFNAVRNFVFSLADGKHDIPFEDFDGSDVPKGHIFRRLLSCRRTFFRANDLRKSLEFGKLESLALPFETYTQVFTKTLAQQTYVGGKRFHSNHTLSEIFADSGGYVHNISHDNWWAPSGRIFYSPNSKDSTSEERTYAQEHFFLPQRYRDPFFKDSSNTESFTTYDKYDLLIIENRDALGNRITVGIRTRNPTQPIHPGYDYRLLAPYLVMDPNRNRTAAAYDILGNVTAIAINGKLSGNEGDELSGFTVDLSESDISNYLNHPLSNPAKILGNATSRMVYDFWSYYRTKSEKQPLPVVTATLTRETHVSDLSLGHSTRIQQSFLYSDGFDRGIQSKILADPDPKSHHIRWIASGWQIFNNKGTVVRQYEPFFTSTSSYESNAVAGVSSTLLYDPLQRLVAKLEPNHSWTKTKFDPWFQEVWDQNDTVLLNPADDPDVSGYFRKIPEVDYLPTWYEARIRGDKGPKEKTAANKAAVHGNTPTRFYFDSLGRSFLTVSHNALQRTSSDARLEEFQATRTLFDISGNVRSTVDALGRVVEFSTYDMANNAIHKSSMEAGEKWTLLSVLGKPIFNWNSRGFQISTAYDELQRPIQTKLNRGHENTLLVSRTMFGESTTNPEDLNLRTKVFKTWDQAVVKTFNRYDFKGNLLSSTIQIPSTHSIIDWNFVGNVALEVEEYESFMTYDALNRQVTSTQPDDSIVRTQYNMVNQVQHIGVKFPGDGWKSVLVDEQYNAKNQCTFSSHENGAIVKYEYDNFTFSLVRISTEVGNSRSKSRLPKSSRPPDIVQDLRYTYDAVKNIVHTRDHAQQKIFFKNHVVDPSSAYTYDALYRLIEASGREHLSQTGAPTPYGPHDSAQLGLQSPGNGNAMGTYTESYYMDLVGNMIKVKHSSSDASKPGWTRRYKYNEPSQIDGAFFNNRVSSTSIGNNTEHYRYDGNDGLTGNMTSMAHLSSIRWDFRDQLHSTSVQRPHNGIPETTFYTYVDSGTRVRKITERSVELGEKGPKKSERVYLGPYEIYREYTTNGQQVSLERSTLHIMNREKQLMIIDAQTQGDLKGPKQLLRYQYTDAIDSSVLELDEEGQLISYEEYYPFGSTSYQALRSQLTDPKRYRYTSKERDTENGFYYHGARYYVPWISRWISADPIGTKDDLDLYVYVKCNPISKKDPTGTEGQDQNPAKPADPPKTAPVPSPPPSAGTTTTPSNVDAGTPPPATPPRNPDSGTPAPAPDNSGNLGSEGKVRPQYRDELGPARQKPYYPALDFSPSGPPTREQLQKKKDSGSGSGSGGGVGGIIDSAKAIDARLFGNKATLLPSGMTSLELKFKLWGDFTVAPATGPTTPPRTPTYQSLPGPRQPVSPDTGPNEDLYIRMETPLGIPDYNKFTPKLDPNKPPVLPDVPDVPDVKLQAPQLFQGPQVKILDQQLQIAPWVKNWRPPPPIP